MILLTIILSNIIVTSTFGLSSNTTTIQEKSSLQNKINNMISNAELIDKIKNEIKYVVDHNSSKSAIAIGFVDPNGTQFLGYGKLSNSSNSTIDRNTIFGIGSITKVFNTILLADMVKDGIVKLNDPIDKYLPSNVTVPQYKGHKITLEYLATHTSGLPEFPANFCKYYWDNFDKNLTLQFRTDIIKCSKNYSTDKLYQGLSNTTISREPGSKFQYSSFGSSLLGHILTQKSNMSSWNELVEKRILSVLGMNSTGIDLANEQKSRLAEGHLNDNELPFWNLNSTIAPSGGLYSTVDDMLKFISANIGLIKTKLDIAMQESHLIRHYNGFLGPNNVKLIDNNNGEGFYAGLGWMINTNYGHEIIWHNGINADGYNSIIAFNPTTLKGIVLLANADHNNIDIANIGLFHNHGLSYLIWKYLNN
jgi:serine-type D-Ala-D-Ala carboxypeptidase/endopeptidase